MHCFCAVEQCGIMEQMSEFSAENGATCLDDYCGKNLKEAYLYCIHMVIMMIESDNRATYQKKASSFFLVLGLKDHNMISDHLWILQMHVLNHSWSYETQNNFKQSNFFSQPVKQTCLTQSGLDIFGNMCKIETWLVVVQKP